MKFIGIIIVAGVLFAAQAQNRPQTAAPNPTDSLQAANAALDNEAALLQLQERRLDLQEKKHELAMRQRMLQENWRAEAGPLKGGFAHSWAGLMRYPMDPRPVFMFMLMRLMVFGFLVFIAMNILLTILVSGDMKRRNSFNGLWVALVLIAGIPSAAIYALFRMRDAIREKKD
jgi:Flp pilus assembly protein TadB